MEIEDVATIGLIFIVIAGSIFGVCRGVLVNESVAIKALETQGYSEIEITDKDWLFVGLRGCDSHDAAKFTAIAKNPVGQEVQIIVCCGWPFKGATIRSCDRCGK